MPKYRVAVCLNEGIVLEIEAANPADAEAEAYAMADAIGGTSYPARYKPNIVHKEFWTQDVEERGMDDD